MNVKRVLSALFCLCLILALLPVAARAAGAPDITDQPASLAVEVGQPASLGVTAAGGTGTLSYQWQKDEADIPGATSATLNIASVQGSDAGGYAVVITDSQGQSATSVTATLTPTVTTTLKGVQAPRGITVDAGGNVYVADGGHDAIKKIGTDGTINTLGSNFSGPMGVAVDASGNIYVADTGNNAVWKMTANGQHIALFASFVFSSPAAVAVDASGNVYVADTGNNAVKKVHLISSSSISPATARFDKYAGSASCADIPVALTLNGNTLSGTGTAPCSSPPAPTRFQARRGSCCFNPIFQPYRRAPRI